MNNQRRPYLNGENRVRNGNERSYSKRGGDGKSYRENEGGKARHEKENYKKGGKKPYKAVETEQAPVLNPDEQPFLIIGRNAVREALRGDRSINFIMASKEPDGSLREIIGLAKDKKVVIREVDRKKLDEVSLPFGHGGKPANHQGIIAYAAGVEYCEVSDILLTAKERNEPPFVIVLDGIEDPHNLGSIIRSAECSGAHGVIIGKRRSASVTAAAVKASAGATEHMKIARVVNIGAAIEELKRAGLWIAGADMAGYPMQKQGLNGALALVVGSEGEGLSKLVKEKCDFLVAIPIKGRIESLNASVAAAILMFEKNRQDEELSGQN
ncbi:MAG: 23S rRNA (guanosine(2251)-2'-O)-methyltransferase RlmB [Clostridia bacterium]|nr:23S rRNA (guanosine(2251)-2'-O)-methyltransferase RlmB [Clostridia bacterium]